MKGVGSNILAVIVAVLLIATGFTDLDWQLVSYRYSEWHRSVDYWEFNPFFKVNWWLAYLLNVGRLASGFLLLGWVLKDLMWRYKYGEKEKAMFSL